MSEKRAFGMTEAEFGEVWGDVCTSMHNFAPPMTWVSPRELVSMHVGVPVYTSTLVPLTRRGPCHPLCKDWHHIIGCERKRIEDVSHVEIDGKIYMHPTRFDELCAVLEARR